jgi:MarR family transcriptional regulator for hemolysin
VPVTERSADLIFLLSQAAHALTAELTARLEGLGISPRSHCVLSQALAAERTQIELASLCALDKTTMVVTVDALEKAGLAERRPSATDRRARVIAVTPAGAEKVRQADEIVASIYADVLDSLPAESREGLLEGLQTLVTGRLSSPPACSTPVRRRRGSP